MAVTEQKKAIVAQMKETLSEAKGAVLIGYTGLTVAQATDLRRKMLAEGVDQQVRGAVVLPHGTGKTKRVLVFAKGDNIKAAEEAGADFVGSEELVAKIQGGWSDFDVVVATPDMMGQVGRLGKILGPKGLMPNPKVGTVTPDVARAVNEIKAGKIEYRTDKAGIISCSIGKASFDEEKLLDNYRTIVDTIIKAKPVAAKGQYIKSVTLSATMGPGVPLNVFKLSNVTKEQ